MKRTIAKSVCAMLVLCATANAGWGRGKCGGGGCAGCNVQQHHTWHSNVKYVERSQGCGVVANCGNCSNNSGFHPFSGFFNAVTNVVKEVRHERTTCTGNSCSSCQK